MAKKITWKEYRQLRKSGLKGKELLRVAREEQSAEIDEVQEIRIKKRGRPKKI